MYKNKNGFTVVELVVVIAVLALLVAVLIPTFSDLVRKANVTKDTQLCRILNEDIAMGVDDAKLQEHATFNDVVEYLSPRYTLENLTPTSNGDIVWDQNTNTFSLIENGKFVYTGSSKTEKNYKANGINLNLWKVVSSIPSIAEQKYSMYLKTNANVANANIVVGFDAGANMNVQTVNYDRSNVANAQAQEVIIRTNGGTLIVNAENDSVIHYGTANVVDIQQIATSSYHEKATSTFIKITKGRLVVEEEAEIGSIFVPETTETVILATRNEAQLPVVTSEIPNKTVPIQALNNQSDTPVETTTSPVLEQATEENAKKDAAMVVTPTFDEKYAACIGYTPFITLAEAFNSITDKTITTTITLLRNASGNGIKVAEGNNIVFNLNGFTYDVDATTVGSTNTETNCFQLLKNSNITFKNGTIKGTSTSAGILIQNYCNLTLDNVVVDGTNLGNYSSTYALSNNFGTILIKDSTLIAKQGHMAFDLWYGMSSVYDGGVYVTVSGNSVIKGKVEYGAASRITGTEWVNTKAVLVIENTVDLSNASFVKSSNHGFSIDQSGVVTVNA